MEIIHVVLGKANPDRMNGVNKVVYQLATRQTAAGQKVSVWGITKSQEHNYGIRNFETRLYSAYRNPFKLDPALIEDLQALRGRAVLHLHGGWIPAFATLSQMLEEMKIPFVLTAHGAYNTVAMERSRLTKKVYFHLIEKWLLRRAARIHCVGESEVAGLQQIYATDKTFLLPYGYEAPANAVKGSPSSHSFTVGFVGRLDIYTKGLDLLLDAFERFATRHPAASLWIIGDSAERASLEKRILTSHLQDRIVLWGSKFGHEKDELLGKMDVFVHPSRNEGLPAAVIEAAAFKIPCIVSHATNVGRYVEEYNGGYVIENGSAQALEQALDRAARLKRGRALERLGENARRMVLEAFSWDMIIQEFSTLYQTA